MLLIISVVVSLYYGSKLTKIDWFVCKLNHSNLKTLINAISVGIRAESNYAALVLLVVIYHYLKDLFRSLEPIHLRHLEVHQDKFVIDVTSTVLEEVVLEFLYGD